MEYLNVFVGVLVCAVCLIIYLQFSTQMGNQILNSDTPKMGNVVFSFLHKNTNADFGKTESQTRVQYISETPRTENHNNSLNLKLSDWLHGSNEPVYMPQCRVPMSDLEETRFTIHHNITMRDIWQGEVTHIKDGGAYTPSDCVSEERLAIIVPYRDRAKHLDIFLNNLHPMLQKQNLNYAIFVIELALPTQFNGGMLKNIGYVTSRRLGNYDCFVFHDVDLIPVNERNIYTCDSSPKHLSSNNSKYEGGIPYDHYVGGVVMFSSKQFEVINGYSNAYFGWGGEDDDMVARLKTRSMEVERPSPSIGKYFALSHGGDNTNPINPQKGKLFKTTEQRINTDGLNSLNCKITAIEFRPLYTWVLVEANERDIMKDIII